MLAFIYFSYSAASRLSFHSWSNAGWWIYLICGAIYLLKMVIIYSFYHWIIDWYRMNDNLNWLTSSSVYLKWKEWWYNIAWICLNWLLLLHQLCLLPEMEVFLNCFYQNQNNESFIKIVFKHPMRAFEYYKRFIVLQEALTRQQIKQ